jgi:YHS domain-containing protein
MLRLILIIVFAIVIARAFWRMFDGIMEGAGVRPAGGVPDRSVAMVRDPVCGTFVLPDRAVTLVHGAERIHFCSDACRDAYRVQPRPERSNKAHGRSA